MKCKIIALSFIICAILAADCHARMSMGVGGRGVTPRVAYVEPKNQSIVDLTGKESLKFMWNKVPMPSGGVQAYRFRVYKGFSYEVVATKELDRGVFEIEVPASTFEDGATYSWKVMQRDANSMNWSQYDMWSFKVVKKNP